MSMRPALLAAVALLLPALAACNSVREAVDGPKMGPMGYPAALVATNQPVLESSREPLPQPATANSLWRTGARTFFNDQRAGRVGDILTVLVTVNDSRQDPEHHQHRPHLEQRHGGAELLRAGVDPRQDPAGRVRSRPR